MAKTRQLLPAGLAEMPPGPGLAAVLARIDLSRLSGLDCIEVMRTRHRQANHEQARFMAATVEVALCGIGPDEQLPRMERPDEFAADEIRAALAWTRRAAAVQLSLAWDLIRRLPAVFAALDNGAIDVPKTRIFSEWTYGLTDEQAHEICDRLLPDAPGLTTGQLSERVKKMAIALDPDWARRRYEEAVRERKVVGYRNEDGTANLSGYSLPTDQVAAACAHIDALAKKIKQAGDRRPIDHIRADLYIGLLDGSFTGWSETSIITHVLAAAAAEVADDASHAVVRQFPRSGQSDRSERRGRHDHDGRGDQAPERDTEDADVPIPHGPVRPESGGRQPVADEPDGNIGRSKSDCGQDTKTGSSSKDDNSADDFDADSPSGGQLIEGPWPSTTPAPEPPPGPVRRMGVEIRVEITTLLGLDDHPAELPGWGHVHADLARRLVREQTDAEWRYALTDIEGHLLYEGITRRRPGGYPARADAPARGGIVELQVPLSTLHRLAARPTRTGAWATVIADLARQADRHTQDDRHGRGRRSHDAAIWDGHDCDDHDARHDEDIGGRDDRENPRRDGRASAGRGGDRENSDGQNSDGQNSERGGRNPGRSLRRRTQIRDRSCVHPGCRAPASGTDGDHTRDWADGGATRDENFGSLCRHDHMLKHVGGWQLSPIGSVQS